MPYTIYQFDSLVLPQYDAETDVGTGEVAPVFLDLPGGGVYDVLGTEPAKRRVTPISRRCTFFADSSAELRATYNALRAYIGKRARLWRVWDSGEAEWCWARLANIEASRLPGMLLHLPVDLRFMMISPHWYGTNHGAAWVFADPAEMLFGDGHLFGVDETIPLTGSPQTIALVNGGNRPVTNAIVTFTAGPIEAITEPMISLPAGAQEWQYNAQVFASTSVVVDTGALAVTSSLFGDDYASFVLTTNHKCEDWLRLAPGLNVITLTYTRGAGGAVTFSYFDGWE